MMANLFKLGELSHDNLILRSHHLGPLLSDGGLLESKISILIRELGGKISPDFQHNTVIPHFFVFSCKKRRNMKSDPK